MSGYSESGIEKKAKQGQRESRLKASKTHGLLLGIAVTSRATVP